MKTFITNYIKNIKINSNYFNFANEVYLNRGTFLWWDGLDNSIFENESDKVAFLNAYNTLINNYVNNQDQLSEEFRKLDIYQWQSYLSLHQADETTVFPIIPLIMKIISNMGISAVTDAMMQVMFYYITNETSTISEAFSKIDWVQVSSSAFQGLLEFWKPIPKLARAAGVGVADAAANFVKNPKTYGQKDFLIDFSTGFLSQLAGGGLSEIATKFSVAKIGKGLVKKLNFPYPNVCSLLGGGVNNIYKSYSHTLSNGEILSITSNKVMKGWDPNKIAVIGRSQDDRVVPFAKKLSEELGVHVHQIKEWPNWNSNLTVEQNKQWIKQLKEEGYTIYDIGTDQRFGSDKGAYYSMEHFEIFGN